MTNAAVDYPSYTSARDHFKAVLDSAARGRIVTVARDGQVSAVVQADLLRDHFFQTISPRVQVGFEDGRAIALMEGRPFVSEGATVDDALDDLVLSLREYTEDWEDHLQHAPNHSGEWALVQLVKLSGDDELKEWFERGGE